MNRFLSLWLIILLSLFLITGCVETQAAEPSTEAVVEKSEEQATTDKHVADEQPISSTNCDAGDECETIYIHQQAGREGPTAAILGPSFAYATQDAVAEINAAGGVCGAMLELIFRETQYDTGGLYGTWSCSDSFLILSQGFCVCFSSLLYIILSHLFYKICTRSIRCNRDRYGDVGRVGTLNNWGMVWLGNSIRGDAVLVGYFLWRQQTSCFDLLK